MHSRDEIIIFREIETPAHLFRLEEFWEEDDSGYCVSDFILARHTRLAVFRPSGERIREFDFDGKEYDKDMRLEGNTLVITWQPEYNERRTVRINTENLEILSDHTEPLPASVGLQSLK